MEVAVVWPSMIMRRMPFTASPWPPRLAALLLSAAAAGSAAYWALHWRVASELPVSAGPVASAGAEVDTTAVAGPWCLWGINFGHWRRGTRR